MSNPVPSNEFLDKIVACVDSLRPNVHQACAEHDVRAVVYALAFFASTVGRSAVLAGIPLKTIETIISDAAATLYLTFPGEKAPTVMTTEAVGSGRKQ